MIAHQKHGSYTALRDVVTEKMKALGQKIFSPFNTQDRDSASEDFWALKNISFDVKQGECIGIIGHNGAGKSTLLKILSRITEPTTGRIRIKGLVGSLLEVGTGFHPELTGRENIFLNGAILGMPKSKIKNKFDEIVDFAEVEKFLDTPVKRYSSGMYVRLAFAVAAHLETEILLVDEVLSVGDINFQKKCLGKIHDVGKNEGRTVLFVSHQLFAIRTLCQKAVWLDSGHIVKIGPSFEVVRSYENKVLQSSEVSSSIVKRSSTDIKKESFYIGQIEMLNTKGENTNIFSYKDSFVIFIDFMGECESNSFAIEFRIYKDSGEYACTGVSNLLHDISFKKDTKRVRIDIGPLILTNGKYNISFRVLAGMRIIDIWNYACSFHIIDCHPFALRREIKRPVCVIQHTFCAVE
jgi:lipopolysaccharide transport system ATP-binding protein